MILKEMRNCIWQIGSLSVRKKEFGGLGSPNIANVNLCLLSSWIKSYNLDEGKLWKSMVDAKYNTNNPNTFCSRSVGVSPF
jgi:hypothetical protein